MSRTSLHHLLPPGQVDDKLNFVVETMREMSRQTDPEEMVRAYVRRVEQILPSDKRMSLSRRGLEYPQFRITRFSGWSEIINPWKQKDRLPRLQGGILADLIYGNTPRILDQVSLNPDDPAFEYFADAGSLLAIPLYDSGEGINMVVLSRSKEFGFERDKLPEWVWMSNLFGRATHTLVIAEELKTAYKALDQEMESVGRIQRNLLPEKLPQIPTLDLAAYYQTSQRAGGDHYECIELPDGRWGMLIADVSGHGTSAAVIAAITHGLATAYNGPAFPPSKLLAHLNSHLVQRYTNRIGAFVTLFYGIYDPATRRITYSSAGHNPPRLKRCSDGGISSLDKAQGLPLGITDEAEYHDAEHQLVPFDQIVFYTDGITEAMNGKNGMFGVERLDRVLESCVLTADGLIKAVIDAVNKFADGHPADDDRTMIVARVS